MSLSAAPLIPTGVLGGTFNPVHHGHLRSALELCERLRLREMRLMPAAVPPHRDLPGCSAEHRAAMVARAVYGEPLLLCDRRELSRTGPSFTIDSLRELREELGPGHSLCLVMGCDALLGIERWHRWQELLDWAHIAVIARPGWQWPVDGVVARWVADRRAGPEVLQERAAGSVLVEELRPLAISSTEIRAMLAAGRSPRYLLPDPVIEYIREHDLYDGGAARNPETNMASNPYGS